MARYESHRLSEFFPLLEGEAYAALVDDIRHNGLQQPVVLFEGKILDGRNRYRACIEAGVECRFETYSDDDPAGYVISLNVQRRHLSTSQKAIVGARMATLGRGRAANTEISVFSQQDAATALAISVDAVQQGRKVVTNGCPELLSAVEADRISVSRAAVIADFRHDIQRQYVRGELPMDLAAMREHARRRRDVEWLLENDPYLSLFPPEEFYFSGSGRKLERVLLKNIYAPPPLKLQEADRTVVEAVLTGLKNLRPIAQGIRKPGAVERFQAAFDAMEKAIEKIVPTSSADDGD